MVFFLPFYQPNAAVDPRNAWLRARSEAEHPLEPNLMFL